MFWYRCSEVYCSKSEATLPHISWNPGSKTSKIVLFASRVEIQAKFYKCLAGLSEMEIFQCLPVVTFSDGEN